eukprot:NODE_2211_length_744_cov_13.106475_g1785_i0.p4 GENE.NODE_2211_length_744_cov_13.106475_g1785_i0~~NODE_2211_length_744_cov_13.106475_g1785_i0.p4  ORF type:complete len:59 (+),score=5.49 NODE_2211_length_744_cov_13.106475_g1785_i0:193-369(+)
MRDILMALVPKDQHNRTPPNSLLSLCVSRLPSLSLYSRGGLGMWEKGVRSTVLMADFS